MNEAGIKNSEKVGLFQIIIVILSVVVLGALGADTIFKLPTEVSNILNIFDTLVCVVLLIDFVVRFYKAESKLTFLKWGWIDLIASIPNVQFLRVGPAHRQTKSFSSKATGG
jgi:voltage-gated potassium channel